MNRRDFIRTTAAAVVLPSLVRAADEESPIPVIDTHTHFYDPTRPEGVPWPPPTDTSIYATHLPPKFHAAFGALPVLGTVVVEASPWLEDNQWLLDLARSNSDIVGIVGSLKPGEPQFAANLKRFAANPLFRGIRIGAGTVTTVSQPTVMADLGRLASANLSLDVIGRSAIVEGTQQIARKWPNLRIIVNHLPFPEWDGNVSALREGLAGLAKQRNVFVKVSAVVRRVDGKIIDDPEFHRPALDALFEWFGPDRLVYGSDWPVSTKIAPYPTVHRIVAEYFSTRGRAAAEKYFWRNSHAAYRWVPRGPAALLQPG
jgi:L-fuconolactonase